MSCITLLTSWRAAARVAQAPRYEIVNTNGTGSAVAQKNRLAMSWFAVTDEKGHRHLEMRWKTQRNEARNAITQF